MARMSIPSTRPRLLDLFCGAGGAAMGYHRAGFDVVGVDIRPQPRYPFAFIQADALGFMDVMDALPGGIYLETWGWLALSDFHAIHASPPCQAFTTARVIHGNDHPDLLTPTRERLQATGVPWVIENVPGSPMRPDFKLCGSMFALGSENGGLIRHRWFETSWHGFDLHPACQHTAQTVSVFGHGGHIYHGAEDWRQVMGIDWMTRDELAQAIPPAYTEHIGGYLLTELQARVA